jgi:tRNA dimethylallyltransferase
MKGKTIHLMGPTASGKSALAMQIAEQFGAEIISVDSAQVYRGMDIGAAKPSLAERARIKHHLVDICHPADSFDAGQFVAAAKAAIASIHAQGKLALLVGGTMLYFRALYFGLSAMPQPDAQVRAQLERQLRSHGSQALHAELATVDPIAAQRIHPNDPQRIVRALEVFKLGGTPISARQISIAPSPDPALLRIGLLPLDRAWLHARIERRLNDMLTTGFLKEVQSIRQMTGFDPAWPSQRAVGYRQAHAFLSLTGSEDISEQFLNPALFATRQLAKRQITWLRADKSASIYAPESAQQVTALFNEVQRFVQS